MTVPEQAILIAGKATPRATGRHGSRAVGVAGTSFLLGSLVVWGTAELIHATDIKEKLLKAQITLVIALLTVVQLSLMVAVSRSQLQRRITLTRVHRCVGVAILLLAGLVTYLCSTGPFRTGLTLHRVAGFTVCTAVLVKITFARVLASRWYLIASVGLTLMIALQVAFFTKSFPVIFGGK